MTEEQKQALIEKCKNEISRYSHLVKTFDPNEGEEMEEYQQNIQDWNDVISVNTLALASLTAKPVKLPKKERALIGRDYLYVYCAGPVKSSIRAAGYQV